MNQTLGKVLGPKTAYPFSLPRSPKRDVGSKQSILIAEDNPDLLAVMGIFLSLMGYIPVPCCDGQVASETFRADSSVAMLITDLEMPGMSGLELARELTAIQRALPVLIVSGAEISDQMREEIFIRNWYFLAKPYVLPTLLRNVQHLMRETASAA